MSQDEVRTLPGGHAQTLVGAHTPRLLGTLPVAGHPPLCGAYSLSSLQNEVRTFPLMGGRVDRRLELLLQGNSPKCPRGSFSFWEKSSCSLLCLPPYKEGPVLSHSPPLQLGQGLSGSGSHAAQLSTLLGQHPWSPWVFHFVLIPLPVTLSNQVSHSVVQALFGRGVGQ